jgi:tetratricopeptide (TPR) repeat protein
MERLINHCLKKNPDARYQSIGDLKSDLEKLRQSLATGEARPYTPTTRFLQQVIRPFRRRSIAIPAAIFLFLLVLILPFRHTWTSLLGGGSKAPPEKGLAVLPFNVIGGDVEDQRFCAGLYETLNSKLTQLQQDGTDLWLVPSVDIIKAEVKSASDAKDTFNVEYVIAASVNYTSPPGVSVTLTLIDAKTPKNMDSRNLSYPSSDQLALRDDIIGRVASMLNIQISAMDQARLASSVSSNAEAAVYFTSGIGYLLDYQNPDSLNNAVTLLTRSIEEDQEFALGNAKLAESYWRRWTEANDPNDLIQARQYCTAALELDDQLAAAHITLGIVNREAGDLEGSIENFKKAFELDPTNADAHREIARSYQAMEALDKAEQHYRMAINLNPAFWGGYSHLGSFFARIGRKEDAEAMFIKVTELAPDNARGYSNLGGVYYLFGWEDQAESAFRRSLEIKPNYQAFSNLATLYFRQQKYAEATEFFENALDLEEDDHRIWGNLGDARRFTADATPEQIHDAYQRAIELARQKLTLNPQDIETRGYLVFYLAVQGEDNQSLDEISVISKAETRNLLALRLCVRGYEIMGMREKALDMLQIYLEAGGPIDIIELNPDLLDMQNDTRYKELIQNQQK